MLCIAAGVVTVSAVGLVWWLALEPTCPDMAEVCAFTGLQFPDGAVLTESRRTIWPHQHLLAVVRMPSEAVDAFMAEGTAGSRLSAGDSKNPRSDQPRQRDFVRSDSEGQLCGLEHWRPDAAERYRVGHVVGRPADGSHRAQAPRCGHP